MSTLKSWRGSAAALSVVDDDEILRVVNEQARILDGRCLCFGCGQILVAGERAQVRRALMADGDLGAWTSCLQCVAAEREDSDGLDGLSVALAQIQDAEDELVGMPMVPFGEAVGAVLGRLSAGWRAAAKAMATEGRG